jgi:hypothetical protein
MKIEERKEVVKTTNEIVSIRYFCDKCKKEILEKLFVINTNKIEFRSGYRFPDGGDECIISAYFCDDCAIEVRKILETNGVIFVEEKRDW